jgi:hypothetical protein
LLFVNRHEVGTLLAIGVAATVAIGTTVVLAAAFLAPTATRTLIGDVGILLAAVGFSGWTLVTLLCRDRLLAWVRHRGSLADSP